MKIKKEISFGEILTAVSIIITAVTLSIGWKKERQIQISKEANRIRNVSVEAYSKVEEWKDLNLLFFDQADELIMNVSIQYSEDRDVVLARDRYWRGLIQLRNALEEKTIDQELRSYHLVMLNNGLDQDSVFIGSVAYIDKLLEFLFKNYINESQYELLQERDDSPIYSEVIGNKLRTINYKYQTKVIDLFRSRSLKLKRQLREIVLTDDSELL
ncbi:hypothetical protein [Ekhidna sp.]|uniref:hypothetical protein n=1 Tax=Ekhidna sp. TaxID=2608089 RepID=UPI0032973D3D